VALTDDLVSFWEFEGNSLVDSHGTNHLTDNNTVGYAGGVVGDALAIVAANSEFASIASNSTLEMGDIDFTICGWVNAATATGNHMIVAKDDDAASSRDFTLVWTASPNIDFYINGGGANPTVSSITLVNTTWYFVRAWHDAGGNTINLQVNLLAPTSTATGGVVPDLSAAQFRLGAREYAGFENYFDGSLDQWGVWKRLLTTEEHEYLYNAGAGRAYSEFAPAGDSVLWLPQGSGVARGRARLISSGADY
jgi:hypothetical protein